LRADRGFRATDFAADLFFFFDLAMMTVVSAILIDWRWENGRLIKNVYPSTQADSPKNLARFAHDIQLSNPPSQRDL
jgi:hypothetical protein